MGPVAQPVFKTGEVWQPQAGSVRLRGRSANQEPLGREECREGRGPQSGKPALVEETVPPLAHLDGQRKVLLALAALERLLELGGGIVRAARRRKNLRQIPAHETLDVERLVFLAQSHRLPRQLLGRVRLTACRVYPGGNLAPVVPAVRHLRKPRLLERLGALGER